MTRRGRPPKPAGEKLVPVMVRLSPAEAHNIERAAKAARVSVSAWCRALLAERAPAGKPVR